MSWRRLSWIVPAIAVISVIVAWRWLLYSESGARWALGSPPAAGAWVDAGVVPIYRVVREKRAPRRLELPVPEPYEVTLWETRGQEASP